MADVKEDNAYLPANANQTSGMVDTTETPEAEKVGLLAVLPEEPCTEQPTNDVLRAELKQLIKENKARTLDCLADKLRDRVFAEAPAAATGPLIERYVKLYEDIQPSAPVLDAKDDAKALAKKPRLYQLHAVCQLPSDTLKFFASLEAFVIQAVCGAIIGPWRAGLSLNLGTSVTSYVVYLNECWHSYHKRTDAFVVERLGAILKHEKIKGSVCLMHWLQKIGAMLLQGIDTKSAWPTAAPSNATVIDAARAATTRTLKDLFILVVLITPAIQCSTATECKDQYDGTDFFLFGPPPSTS